MNNENYNQMNNDQMGNNQMNNNMVNENSINNGNGMQESAMNVSSVDPVNPSIDTNRGFGTGINLTGEQNPNMGMPNMAPQMMNPNAGMSNNQNNPEKKKSKLPIIIGTIVLAVILIVVGVLFFIKSKYSAESFIDTNVKTVTSYIEKVFSYTSGESLDILSDDVKTSGSLTITSTNSELSFLNNLKIDYALNESIKNEYADLDFTLSQNSNSLNAKVNLDKKLLYLTSKDLSSDTYKYNIDVNVFSEIKESLKDYNDLMNLNNIKYLLTKSVEYMATSFKEAEISSKTSGTKVEYVYEVNDNNRDKIIAKYKELTGNDEKFNSIKETLGDSYEEDIDIENFTLKITINMLSNKVENFEFTVDDEKYIGELVSDNKYKITFDEGSFNLEITDNKINLTAYDKDNKYLGYFKVETSSKNTNIEYKDEGNAQEVNITINKESDKKNKITGSVNVDDYKLDIDMNITADGKKTESEGTLKFDINGVDIALNIKESLEYGSSIVNKETISNAKDINELTEYELYSINENLTNKLSSFEVIEYISTAFGSLFGSSYSTYDPYGMYDYDDYYSNYDFGSYDFNDYLEF